MKVNFILSLKNIINILTISGIVFLVVSNYKEIECSKLLTMCSLIMLPLSIAITFKSTEHLTNESFIIDTRKEWVKEEEIKLNMIKALETQERTNLLEFTSGELSLDQLENKQQRIDLVKSKLESQSLLLNQSEFV